VSSPAIEFTSGIGAVISRFVALKQGLGFRYETQQYLLAQFDRFLATRAEKDLTQESFSAWCSSIEHITAGARRMRMQLVRQLCVYRRRRDPACFVPDPTQFPPPPPRRRPHIFSTDEIVRLLDTANALRPWGASPLYRQVARLAVVLLYTAGLRRGEVVRLSLGDYDSVDRSLLVRDSKFHKSRIIPLSQDAVGEIVGYFRHRRGRGYPLGAPSPLLIHRHGSRLIGYSGEGLRNMLRHLFKRAKVRTDTGCPPRVHDLRFTFAYHALQRWYRTGVDVQQRLPALATYMGHSSILSTEYYLPVLDVVAEQAGERFERHCAPFLSTICGERGAR